MQSPFALGRKGLEVGLSDSKVTNLGSSVTEEQNIGRLDVSMNNSVVMNASKSVEAVKQDGTDCKLSKKARVRH